MLTIILYFFVVLQCYSAEEDKYQIDSDQFLQPKKYFEYEEQPTIYTNLQLGPQNQPLNAALYYHQYANFVAWAFLVDFGIIINRYGILIKKKMDLHAIIMFICVVPSIAAELIAIFGGNFPNGQGDDGLNGVHSIIGYIFLGLMIFQTVGGIIVKFCISSIYPQTHLKLQSLIHKYLGYVIYLLGKIQLGFGYYLAYNRTTPQGKANVISFWCIYGLMFFWRSIIEFFYFNGKLFLWFLKKKEAPRQHSGTLQDSLLIQYIEQNEQSQISNEFKNRFWVIFDNEIVDLTGFIHPGGQYIWEKIKGREVSRFIFGGAGLEDGTAKQWVHSNNAILLIKKNVIGSLNNVVFMAPIDENDATLDSKWKLVTITKLNDKTSYFGFTNTKYNIISQFKSIHFFGKYFQIQSLENTNLPIRQYTCISSMAPENVTYRKELVKYIDYVVATKQQAKIPAQPKYLTELPLMIKCYESKNGFSQYIHQHKDELYDIKGPYGPPHGIPTRGKVVIICGGTGIFPFLDLLDFLLKTVINQVALTKFGKQMADNLNLYECEFNPNIHITLFFAVANKAELIGQDIIFPIIQLQKYLDKEYMKLIIKIKDKIEGIETVEERFGQELFSKYLGKISDYQKYLICGPPQMQQQVPVILQKMGIEQQYIHFI